MKISFENAFLEMLRASVPDLGMTAEIEPPVDRYIGEGAEPFYYSIRLNSPCTKDEFESAVLRELQLAKSRARQSFEWKIFELPKIDFLPDTLKRHGFILKRQSRLMYMAADFKINCSNRVTVKPVLNGTDFELLLDVNEKAFGRRSDWLKTGLRREIIEKPNLVKAFIAFVDETPAACAWIKIYSNIGFLFGGGTIPELRGNGAYKAIVNERAKFANSVGVDFIISECSPDSERVLRSLEFVDAGNVQQFVFNVPS